MKKAVLFLIVTLFALATIAPAQAQLRSYGQLDQSAGDLYPAASGGKSLADMSVEQITAVGVGAVVGYMVIDTLLGGGLLGLVGLAGGALAGYTWYEEGMWPFH